MRRGKRHRYYVSHRLIAPKDGADETGGWRIPAHAFETAIATAVANHLEGAAPRLLAEPGPEPEALARSPARLNRVAKDLGAGDAKLLRALLHRVDLSAGAVLIALNAPRLAAAIGTRPDAIDPTWLSFSARFQMRRRGVERKLVIGDQTCDPDRTLLRAVALAHAWLDAIRVGATVAEIAQRAGKSPAVIRQRLPLATLSPAIVEAILDGRQPPDLTLDRLLRRRVSMDWNAQAKTFGVNQRAGA